MFINAKELEAVVPFLYIWGLFIFSKKLTSYHACQPCKPSRHLDYEKTV